jgi:hypothetical protein
VVIVVLVVQKENAVPAVPVALKVIVVDLAILDLQVHEDQKATVVLKETVVDMVNAGHAALAALADHADLKESVVHQVHRDLPDL